MKKYNCWEFHKCGMGNGATPESGLCPIFIEASADGLNGGINGGRLCWIIAGKLSGAKLKCLKLNRKSSCAQCEFRCRVTMEEGLLNVCRSTGVFLTCLSSDQRADILQL